MSLDVDALYILGRLASLKYVNRTASYKLFVHDGKISVHNVQVPSVTYSVSSPNHSPPD